MFVRKSKYDLVEQQLKSLRYEFELLMQEHYKKQFTDDQKQELETCKKEYGELSDRNELLHENYLRSIHENAELLTRYHKLEDEVNRLRSIRYYEKPAKQASSDVFTPAELKRLIGLIHPDKHDNKPSSVELTQKVLKMMGK